MPDIMTAAMEESNASRPAGVVYYDTFEIMHPEFDSPYRFVTGRDTDMDATLEANAPYDPGDEVTFTAVAFDVVPPGMDDAGPTPARVTIDNVSGIIADIMKLTRAGNSAIECVYRLYRSDGLLEPGQVIRGLKLKEVEIRARTVSGTLGFDEVETQHFPLQTFDKARFPALWLQG